MICGEFSNLWCRLPCSPLFGGWPSGPRGRRPGKEIFVTGWWLHLSIKRWQRWDKDAEDQLTVAVSWTESLEASLARSSTSGLRPCEDGYHEDDRKVSINKSRKAQACDWQGWYWSMCSSLRGRQSEGGESESRQRKYWFEDSWARGEEKGGSQTLTPHNFDPKYLGA